MRRLRPTAAAKAGGPRVLIHIEHEIPPNRVEIKELRKLLTELERETYALQDGKSSS
jgi:hypothetical protein